MSRETAIEWTDSTFNPFIGCTKVSPGCDHCYAEHLMDHRMHKVVWGPKGERVRTGAADWKKPVQWNAQHEAFFAGHGRRQRVFCASLADVFDNAVPQQWRVDLFELIRATPHLSWQLLTKRIGNATAMLPRDWGEGWPQVWLGATVVNQEEADRDIPKLLATPARVRFLSMEPLLEQAVLPACAAALDWIIVGGESGPHARYMDTAWARSLREQCAGMGIAYFFKQMSSKAAIPADLLVREVP